MAGVNSRFATISEAEIWKIQEDDVLYSVYTEMGSEFLTPNNLWKLLIIVPDQQLGFTVSDPWQIRGTVLYSAYTEMGSGFFIPVFAYGEKETVLIKTTAFNQIT